MSKNRIEVLPQYVDGEIMTQPKTLWRVDGTLGRYYEDEHGFACPSATTITKMAMPYGLKTNLIKWYASMGMTEAEAYAQDAADRGTLGHIIISYLVEKGKLNVTDTERMLNHFYRIQVMGDDYDPKVAEAGNINYPTEWASSLMKQLYSCAKFIQDYDVRPYGIEVTLQHEDGYAGTVDLVCTMLKKPCDYATWKKSTAKDKGTFEEWRDKRIHGPRHNAIVDWKFGKSLHYPDHPAQLFCYKALVEHNYPGLKIEAMFNVRPKDWRDQTNPTYSYELSQDYMTDGKDYFTSRAYYEATWNDCKQVFRRHWPDFIASRKGTAQFNGEIDLSNPETLNQTYIYEAN